MLKRRERTFSLILSIALFILTLTASISSAQWREESPTSYTDKTVIGSTLRSIAISPDTNNPHIVYGGDALYHAYYDGIEWQYETVDSSSVGDHISVAVDSNGKVHISFYSSYRLKYATNATGSWTVSTIPGGPGGQQGFYNSIAVDSNKRVHVSYYDSSDRDLKYATNVTGSWVVSTVDYSGYVGQYSSIAIDSNDNAHISYYDATNEYLKYATNAPGTWNISYVDLDSVGEYSSIAVDWNNKAHISYYDALNDDLKYATNTSGSWVASTVDSPGDVGQYTSIAVDVDNYVHISYHDVTNNCIKYATNTSGLWIAYTVDNGENNSIALDSAGRVHIDYGSIKYVTNSPGSWVTSIIDQSYSLAAQSLAAGSNSKAHICYKDTLGKLFYVTNLFGIWVSDEIEGVVNGERCSIAADSSSKVHISYYENDTSELKYATNTTGSWISETVDINGGSYSRVTLDPNDKFHIAYYQSSSESMKYATNASGSWITETIVDGQISPGAIRADANGKAHVTYRDDGIYYATNESGSWNATYIPGTFNWPSSPLVIDSNNRIHSAYLDHQCADGYYPLIYGTNTFGVWLSETAANVVEDVFCETPGIDLALDANGKAHILYTHVAHLYIDEAKLSYTTNVSGSWESSYIGAGGYRDWWLFRLYPIAVEVDSEGNVHYMKNFVQGFSLYFDSDKYGTNIPAMRGTPIAAGYEHTLYVQPDGSLWAWGHNDAGQLGDGTTTGRLFPVRIGSGSDWLAVSAGWKHTAALKQDRSLWAWGENDYGQVGDGTTTDRYSPIQIGSDTDWAVVASGGAHNLALKSNGELWAWGLNSNGQLGDGTTSTRTLPVRIGLDEDWMAIAAGWEHSVALKSNGELWAWGWNEKGQVGDGTTTDRLSPVLIGTGYTAVSAGWKHTLALKSGELWAWGCNEFGQLGDGTTVDRLSPVQIGSDTDWLEISAGGVHNQALKSDRSLWAWGGNFKGQVGDGTTTQRDSPKRIGSDTDWLAAAAGWEHSLALKEDGSFWIWGWNEYGQIGDGTTTDRYSPVTLSVPRADFTASPLNGPAPLTVDFTNNSGGLDQPLSYEWDFDNNGTVDSTEESPSYTYNNEGMYTVKLTVTDSDGDPDALIRTDYITVICPVVRIQDTPATYYSTLQDAYNAALDGDIIQSRVYTFTEDLNVNLNKSVTIEGGYDCDFSYVAGNTTINGNVTVDSDSGTVTMGNIVLE